MTILARAATVVMFCLLGCATAPKTPAEEQALAVQAESTLREMRSREPALGKVLAQSAGYAVFPSVGKGGIIVGGAFGRGVLYQRGRRWASSSSRRRRWARCSAAEFAELLVLRDPVDVANIRAGRYSVGADASVVALTAGAAASAQAARGTTVFMMPHGGLMVDVSVAGQRTMLEKAG